MKIVILEDVTNFMLRKTAMSFSITVYRRSRRMKFMHYKYHEFCSLLRAISELKVLGVKNSPHSLKISKYCACRSVI